MNNITEHSFSEYYDIASGISSKPEQAGHGYPFVSFSTVFNNCFLPDIMPDYMDTSEQERVTYSVKEGDVLLTRTSETFDELAMSSVALKDYPDATFSGFVKRLRPKTKAQGVIDTKYLGFYLRGYLFRHSVTNHSILTLRASFNEDIFSFLKLYLPDYEQQTKIGDYLYLLEKKITLNNSINAELEKTAKLLYDYWFVQFDFPNAEGKPYRASGGEMVYNEQLKREIPKGWEAKSIRQCVSSIKTGLNPRQNFMLGSGENRYITIKNIVNGFLDFSSCDFVDDAALVKIHNRSDIAIGDILFTSIDPVGRLYWIRETPADWDINESVFSIRTNTEVVSTEYLYAVMDSSMFRTKLIPLRTGSVQKGIRIGALESVFVAKPYDSVMEAFSTVVKPLYRKMGGLEKQNRELTSLRDFLLPLLMNGQVVVKDVATVAESAKETPANMSEDARRAAVFKRLVLSAYILDNICDEPTAGRVKFEKLLYLSEHCAELPLHSEFQRAAAGPYDAQALHSIESQLQKNKWFKRQKVTGESRAYTRMTRTNGYKAYVSKNLESQQKVVIDKLIRLFKSALTIQCEIVATLYGAWNDFLIDGVQPSNEQIVDEVLTNWHESKERIDRSRWFAALDWMRQNEIVPTGYGVSTKNT